MPRIKKDKEFVIPEHIKAKISEVNDTLLTIKRYGEYKVGEKYRTHTSDVGTIYGFVNLAKHNKNRVFVLAKFTRSGGRYDDGFYIYEVKG